MGKRFIITSCGRSGSKFIATALNYMGIPTIHEMGDDWPYPTDRGIKYIPANKKLFRNYKGFVGWKWPILTPVFVDSFNVQFHSVRHPIKAITSATTHADALFKAVEKVIGQPNYYKMEDKSDILLTRAVNYWIHYNKIFSQGKTLLKLEEFKCNGASIQKFCEMAGYPLEPSQLIENIPTTLNSRPNASRRIEVTWGMLEEKLPKETAIIDEMCQLYGYER
jgi:hypothetical protein